MNHETLLQPHRVRVLFIAIFGNLTIWTLTAFFATSEFYRRSIVMGGAPAVWSEVLDVQLVTALNWAMFTPFVVLLAQLLPLRAPHRLRNAVIIVALLPLLAMLRAAMGGIVLNLGENHPIARSMITYSINIRTHRYIAIIAVIFFVYNLADAQREAAKRERHRLRAQTLLARTEIDELRTRFQPQFAIRMLRHIGAALREEPRSSDALIVDLSSILRRSMTRDEMHIRLADELEHFDRCVELCRADGRFAVNARYVADDEVLATRVPALVLQPLIETVVLDLTSGGGGAVDVHCARDGETARVEARWWVVSADLTKTAFVRIPLQEAFS